MGDLHADVHDALLARENIHVFRERAPAPREPLAHGTAGDVLHALHQLDQPVVAFLVRGREPHAAVAHHRGGNAVPAAGGEPRVPRGLRVVVGVDVHPAGGEQQTVSVNHAVGVRGAGTAGGFDRCDGAVDECDVGVAPRFSGSVHQEGVADDRSA